MTEYVSKQVAINKPDHIIYQTLCSFDNFTPIAKDKVECWQATEDTCSFKAKGLSVKLKMVDKEPSKVLKISGDEMPFEFFFWIQLKQVAENDTRMRLTLRANLNPMMKMMFGKKMQKGIDEIAQQMAASFNSI